MQGAAFAVFGCVDSDLVCGGEGVEKMSSAAERTRRLKRCIVGNLESVWRT